MQILEVCSTLHIYILYNILIEFLLCILGLDTQIQEIKESVELPLTHPEYYEEMGIRPPKGVILYGPPVIDYNKFTNLNVSIIFQNI
jgi:hypothetical protein